MPGQAMVTEPTEVDVGGTAERIAAGAAHTCAVLDGGAVRCWGSNASGQLGLPGVGMVGDDETPGSREAVDVGFSVARSPVAPRIPARS